MHAWLTQDVPREDQRQLLLSVPFVHMSLILQALPGQACMEALLSIGAPLCKDLLLSMPSPTSVKLLHAASTADLAKLIQVSRLPYHRAISVLNLAQVFCVCTPPVSLSFTNLPEHPSTLRNVSFSLASATVTAVYAFKLRQDALSYSQGHTISGFTQKKVQTGPFPAQQCFCLSKLV